MTLKDLKNKILTNTLADNFIIFLYQDNKFICNQYINYIAKNKQYNINKLNTLAEVTDSALSLVFNFTKQLNILDVDTFEEVAADYSDFKNCIVVCSKISNSVINLVKPYVVEIPKLVDWQIKDYIATTCEGLEQDEINWLFSATNGDIFRLTNELDKIKLFPIQEQRRVLNALRFASGSDLYAQNIFKLTDAILEKDKFVISDYLIHQKACEIDPFSIISILIKNLKLALYINFSHNIDISELGLSQKQINGIKMHYKNCSETKLASILAFLTKIDQQVKLGQLELSREQLIDYLISNLFNL